MDSTVCGVSNKIPHWCENKILEVCIKIKFNQMTVRQMSKNYLWKDSLNCSLTVKYKHYMNVFVNKHSYDITAKHFRSGYFHHNTPVTNKKYRTMLKIT